MAIPLAWTIRSGGEQTIGEINAIASSIAAAVEEQGAATAEIARNVSETASAANEMTNRTAEVSSEAEQTGRRAVEVRENTGALNNAVGELRHSVVRVVRTSTAEVDRRQDIRRQIDLPCRLSSPGHDVCTAHVTDISLRGASVSGGPSLRPAARGTLHLASVGVDLPFSVHDAAGDSLHLMFELDSATTTRLGDALERLTLRRAA
jgi:methyl-accepting chemotaxis protein